MILSRLRETTKPYHDRLEQHLALLETPLTVERYRRLLQRFYGYYVPLEKAAVPLAAQLPFLPLDLPRRRKTPLLERDLSALGVNAGTRAELPCCRALPSLKTVPTLFGCLYVLEGATLGGQLITRHLQQTLNIFPENGGSFFASYGPAVGVMWKEFGSVLMKYAETAPEVQEAILISASATFQTLHNWMAEESICP